MVGCPSCSNKGQAEVLPLVQCFHQTLVVNFKAYFRASAVFKNPDSPHWFQRRSDLRSPRSSFDKCLRDTQLSAVCTAWEKANQTPTIGVDPAHEGSLFLATDIQVEVAEWSGNIRYNRTTGVKHFNLTTKISPSSIGGWINVRLWTTANNGALHGTIP